MRTNSFTCPICGKPTRHYEISLQEVIAIDSGEEKTIMDRIGNRYLELIGGAADWTGIGRLYETIVGQVPYKCGTCQRCAWRNSKGQDVRYIGYAH